MTETTPNLRRKLSTVEVAEYTGLSKKTLEKLRVSGGGPVYFQVGRRCLYDPDLVDEWLEQHRRRSTAERQGKKPSPQPEPAQVAA